MITLEQAEQIGKKLVEDAGFIFDYVYFLPADKFGPAMYCARGLHKNGNQAVEGIDIKKAILAEDGTVIDYELPIAT